jgi:hypothetical protein
VITDDQLIDEVRRALTATADGIDPRPDLLQRVHRDLSHMAAPRRQPRLPGALLRMIVPAMGVAVAIAIAVIALVLVDHGTRPVPPQPEEQVPVGTAQLAAEEPDPSGGLQWGLRTFQSQRLEGCMQVGRLQSGQIGALGQDGAFSNDGRFHPIPLHENFPCAQTDASGHLFLNIFEQQMPASAPTGSTHGGCRPSSNQPPPSVLRRLRRRPPTVPTCPAQDLRNLAYGVLGPDAVSITYTRGNQTVTQRTGPDGAYLIVTPATEQSCTIGLRGGGRSCIESGGEITTSTPGSEVITAITYRDGHVCHLPTLGLSARAIRAAGCPNVGYVRFPPFHPPTIAEAQASAPMTVRILKAHRYCYSIKTSLLVTCDHTIPHGYKPASPGASPRIALVDISFTARLAADNHRSVYELSYGRAAGPANCTLNTGATSGTTMHPIKVGQRVTIQDYQEVCPGTYAGLVTYQPNGGPGRDTLNSSFPIHDHSILVGRFKYVLR